MARGVIQDFVQDEYGNKIVGAFVTVKLAGTSTSATVYNTGSGGLPITNPLTTDSDGFFRFFAESGDYDLDIVGGGNTYLLRSVPAVDADAQASAESSADAASVSETNAAASEASAAADAAAAKAAAEASGDITWYDTKADLDAALGSHSNDDIGGVFADEDNDGAVTKYRRELGAWVLKVVDDLQDTSDFPYLEQGKLQQYWVERGLVRDGVIPNSAPSLHCDYVNQKYQLNGEPKTFDDIHTFTRASAANAFRPNGRMHQVASGEPVFDYDPNTGKAEGLRIEPAQTLLNTAPEDFTDAAWNKSGCTANSNVAIAPDGSQLMDELVEDTSTGVHEAGNAVAADQTDPYSAVVYVKRGVGSRNASLRVLGLLDPAAANLRAFVDLSTGEITSEAAGSDTLDAYFSSRLIGGGIVEVKVMCSQLNDTDDGNVSLLVSIVKDTSTATYVGDGASSIYVWGGGLYSDKVQGSYVDDGIGTRNKDLCKIESTVFDELYKEDSGTFVVKGRYYIEPSVNPAAERQIISISDGTTINKMRLANTGGGDVAVGYVETDSSGNSITGAGLDSTDEDFVAVLTHNGTGGIKTWINGIAYIDDNTDVSGGVFDRINVGSNQGDGKQMGGYIKELLVFPQGVSDEEALALSKF